MYRVWNILPVFALLMLCGAVLGLVAANLAPGSYQALIQYPLWFDSPIGPHVGTWTAALGDAALAHDPGDAARVMTLRALVNEGLMALVLAFVAKELWEGIALRGGELRGKGALLPLAGALGGVLAPAALYLAVAGIPGPGTYAALAPGWAVTAATEMALAYVIGRHVFGAGHAAIRFLLLLTLAGNGFGMLVLLAASGPVQPGWLALSFGAALGVWFLCNWLPRRLDRGDQIRRRSTFMRQRLSFWPYALAGILSWYGFARAGVNPALGLLPIIPALPHSDRPFGIFAEAEAHLGDLLNTIQHGLKLPVAAVFLLFGLVNFGITPALPAAGTWAVAAALLLGKPLGIALGCWLASRLAGAALPAGLRLADLPALGCAAGAGMTLAVLTASAMLPAGPQEEAVRLGLLLGLASAPLAVLLARIGGVVRRP